MRDLAEKLSRTQARGPHGQMAIFPPVPQQEGVDQLFRRDWSGSVCKQQLSVIWPWIQGLGTWTGSCHSPFTELGPVNVRLVFVIIFTLSLLFTVVITLVTLSDFE